VVAVSPIVGGAAFSGPAGKLMQSQGLPVSVDGVARGYADFLDALIIDERDAGGVPGVESLGIAVSATNTIMQSSSDKEELARATLVAARAVEKLPS